MPICLFFHPVNKCVHFAIFMTNKINVSDIRIYLDIAICLSIDIKGIYY